MLKLQEKSRKTARTEVAGLRTNTNFNILWFGQSLSVLGDGFALVALPLLVLQTTQSATQMGLLAGLMGVGQLVTTALAGPIVDCFNRRFLMIGCDVIRTLLYLSIAVCWWTVGPELWLIFVAVGIASCLDVFFDVSYTAVIAEVVPQKQLTQANGRLQATRALSYLLGPMLAGLLSVRLGLPFALFVDACSFLLSAFSLLALVLHSRSLSLYLTDGAVSETSVTLFAQDSSTKTFRRDLQLGFRFIWRQPTLRAVVAQLSVFMILTGSLSNLIMFRLKHDLGISNEVAAIMFGLGCLGGIAAGMSVSKLRKLVGFGACWIGALCITGLAIIASVLTSNVFLLTLLAMCFSFGRILTFVTSTTLPQELTPNRLLGRVSSAVWLVSASPAPLGVALASVLADRFGSANVFLLIGGSVVLLSILALLTPARQARPVKEASMETGLAWDDISLEPTLVLEPYGMSQNISLQQTLLLQSFCPRCGATMPVNARYCGRCGQSLLKPLTFRSGS